MSPNKLEAGAGADDEGADAPVVSALEAGGLSWGFPKLENSDGALVEGAAGPELAGFANKLNAPGAAVGDVTGFAVEVSGWVGLGWPNKEGVACAVDVFADG